MNACIRIEAILFKRTDGQIQYLILKRHPSKSHPEMGQFWQPITGGLEKGETKREALKREIKEETGIENIIKMIENVHYYEFQDLPFMEYLKRHGQACKHLKEYVFGVEVSSDETVILDGKEHSECRWCGFKEALRLLKWKENKEALEKLNKTLSKQK